MYLDGSNAENKISLLVILCIIMYVKKNQNRSFFFFTKPIMVKCLNIGKNIGQPIFRSISTSEPSQLSLNILSLFNLEACKGGCLKHVFQTAVICDLNELRLFTY